MELADLLLVQYPVTACKSPQVVSARCHNGALMRKKVSWDGHLSHGDKQAQSKKNGNQNTVAGTNALVGKNRRKKECSENTVLISLF